MDNYPSQGDQNVFDHIFESYFNLRTGIAALAILFPLVLWLGGKLIGIELRESMSAYYLEIDGKTMRDWFVGILWAIGVFLILYKGWERKQGGGLNENWALNLAGLCAIGVAMFPTTLAVTPEEKREITLHGTLAFSLFLFMAYVCIFRARDTLGELNNEKLRKRFKRIYVVLGVAMVFTPFTAWCFAVVLHGLEKHTFYVEWFGVWVFAFYWLVKSSELSISGLEQEVPDITPAPLPINTPHHVTVHPGVLNYPTGVTVATGEEYRITASGEWLDWFIRCGPNGWGDWCPLKKHNRKPGEPFFLLCGNVGKHVDDTLAFCIGEKREWVVPGLVKDGQALEDCQLYLFANDVPIAYGNNRQLAKNPMQVIITLVKRNEE